MEAVIERTEAGVVSIPEAPARTIPGAILSQCRALGERTYTRHWDGNGWVETSWNSFAQQSLAVAAALIDEGVKAGDRVLLMSENRIEWLLCDLGIQCAGAVTVPVYPSSSVATVKSIIKSTEPVFAIASSEDRADKIRTAGLEKIRLIVPDVDRWRARALEPQQVDGVAERLRGLSPDGVATVIPTSGTTGEPKGVILLHRNFTDMAAAALSIFDFGPEDMVLSFMPYAHSYERIEGIFTPSMAGCTITLTRGLDRIREDLAEVRPSAMMGFPRMFEKFHQTVLDMVAEVPVHKRLMFRLAMGVGTRRAARNDVVARGPLEWLADRFVLKPLHRRVTGGRLRFFVSGGAPLNQSVEEFFWALGVKILQGWGLTETTAAATANTETEHRYRTVGKPLPGMDLKIAEDGEILVRGPAVMAGYMNKPEETAEVLVDGWLRTGDIGFVDAQGFLTITDRKKDLIKTAGGKYIAPQPIEAGLMADRYVASAMVIGDTRPYAVALIVPEWAALERDRGLTGERVRLCEDPAVRAYFRGVVDGVNRDLAGFETVKRFALLPADFSEAAGELTPTLKPRRRIVVEHNQAVIDALYAQPREAAEPA